MTSTVPRVRHRVIPFHLMTDRQAAEHMVACHGFDEAYHWGGGYAGLPEKPTRENALAYWEAHATTWGASEHGAEHRDPGEFDGLGGGIPHTHTKAVR